MINRRTLIKLGMGGAFSGISVTSGLAGDAAPAEQPLYVLVDSNSRESQRHAENLRGQGASLLTLENDLGSQWFGKLKKILQESPGPLAGLTDQHTLFCLEELARDVGLKVRIRVDHHAHNRNTETKHELRGLQAQKANGPRPVGSTATQVTWLMS